MVFTLIHDEEKYLKQSMFSPWQLLALCLGVLLGANVLAADEKEGEAKITEETPYV